MIRDALPNTIPGGTPEAIAVERALIGGCILDTRGSRVWPHVMPEHFYLERHRNIWAAMLDCTEYTDRPDVLLITEQLSRMDQWEPEYRTVLAQALEDGACAVELSRYAELVRRGAMERGRIALAAEVMANPEGSERLEALLRTLDNLPGQVEDTAAIVERLKQGTHARSYETGLKAIDSLTSGIQAGQLAILYGRLSHGKTALGLFLSLRWALEAPVEYMTLEDSPEEIVIRALAILSGRSHFYVKMSKLAGLEIAEDDLAGRQWHLVTVPGRAEKAVLGAVSASRASIIIVDHLQQVVTAGENRQSEIEGFIRRLSAIAGRDDKAILLSCQAGRDMENDRREPHLGDLRDSDAMAQLGRKVFAVYWPSKHAKKADKIDPALYQVLVLKNSSGPTGRATLYWNAKTGQFRDVEDAK